MSNETEKQPSNLVESMGLTAFKWFFWAIVLPLNILNVAVQLWVCFGS